MSHRDLTCWRELLSEALAASGKTISDIEALAPADLDLDRKFDYGYGGSEGRPFTAWTSDRVYFPGVYDGLEWVASVPRHPNGEVTDHIGGE